MQRATSPRLVLASASPRRLELLSSVCIVPDEVAPSSIDETSNLGERPRDTAIRLAKAKLMKVVMRYRGAFVLAADTVVECGGKSLPKTWCEDVARGYLKQLSGRRHRVHTGVTVIDPDGRVVGKIVSTRVAFKRLGKNEMEVYLAGKEWQDMAGGYAIQGRAAAFARSINGSYTNIIGLPLVETVRILNGLGYPTT